jgi:hypothetical protein
MSHTETVEEHLKISDWRIYLDSGSSQYNKTGIQEKLETLASVVYHKYDLAKIIEEYKTDYSLPGYKHIYDNLSGTLIELMSFLKVGNITEHKVRKQFEEESQAKVISEFILLLQEKIIPQFSIEKLVLSYIDYKNTAKAEEYKRQSSFFHIDLGQDNRKQLLSRTEKEKLDPYLWGYVALSSYLHNSLFGDLHENRISDLTPELDMPMTKGIIHFIHKHYPQAIHTELNRDDEFRKGKILEFVIDLVEILYFDKPMEAKSEYESIIADVIQNIGKEYDENELAYLCLTSKVENPLRDKIAFQLHKQLGENKLVCREWTNKGVQKNKSDIAILDFDDNVECIIEFKAHSSIQGINEWLNEMEEDISKAKEVSLKNTAIFFVLFVNNLEGMPEGNHFEHSVKYHGNLQRGIKKSSKEVADKWKQTVSAKGKLNYKPPVEIEISAGEYYLAKTAITCFIHGPYYK